LLVKRFETFSFIRIHLRLLKNLIRLLYIKTPYCQISECLPVYFVRSNVPLACRGDEHRPKSIHKATFIQFVCPVHRDALFND
jgi:hypothetical protein